MSQPIDTEVTDPRTGPAAISMTAPRRHARAVVHEIRRHGTPPNVPEARPRDGEPELAALVRDAREGDADAWRRLVRSLDGTLRRIARSYRLAEADVDEVVQAAWLDLVEHIGRIREPAAIAGWLATVTRRHALRRLQGHVRELLTDDVDFAERPDCDGPEARVLTAERGAVLAGALESLPDRQRRLVTVLLTQPELDYRQVGELLCMPVGSIGPIRARALARLAGDAQLRGLVDSPMAS